MKIKVMTEKEYADRYFWATDKYDELAKIKQEFITELSKKLKYKFNQTPAAMAQEIKLLHYKWIRFSKIVNSMPLMYSYWIKAGDFLKLVKKISPDAYKFFNRQSKIDKIRESNL